MLSANRDELRSAAAGVSREHYRRLVQALSPAERLERTLALSWLVRQLVWEGARRRAGAAGTTAVQIQFLRQLYGREGADQFAKLLGLTPAS